MLAQHGLVVTKRRSILLPIALAGCLLAGCISFDSDKFETQVKKWVPVGTSLSEARRTMEKRGFDCEFIGKDHPLNRDGTECLDCERAQVWFHTWNAKIFFHDGKVSGYGDLTVE